MTTLDELRRANLREQRRSADERLAPKEPTSAAPGVADNPPAEKAAHAPIAAEETSAISPSKTAPPLEKTVSASPDVQATQIVAAPPAERIPAPQAMTLPVAANGAHTQSNPLAAASNPSHAVPGAVPPADVTAVTQTENLVDRVHLALARKVIHPTGVKATVDMPPDLFWRLKRYCRDRNNVTVRQVFLDLMIAYLDEEGY